MAEILSPVLREDNSRMVALILLFISIFGSLYLFFSVMNPCVANNGPMHCFKTFWLFYVVITVICGVMFVPFMAIILQIAFQFKVRDDFVVQLRRKAELENIKTLKAMKYKVVEKEFSEGIKKLIGKYRTPPKKKKWYQFWKK